MQIKIESTKINANIIKISKFIQKLIKIDATISVLAYFIVSRTRLYNENVGFDCFL